MPHSRRQMTAAYGLSMFPKMSTIFPTGLSRLSSTSLYKRGSFEASHWMSNRRLPER